MSFNHTTSLLKPRLLQPMHEAGEDRLARFDSRVFDKGSSGGASTPVGHSMHEVFLLTLERSQPAAEKPHRFTMTISRYSLGTTIVVSSALFMRPMRS